MARGLSSTLAMRDESAMISNAVNAAKVLYTVEILEIVQNACFRDSRLEGI